MTGLPTKISPGSGDPSPGELLSSQPLGSLIADMSTIALQAVRRMHAALRERGIALLDAPVSGGPVGAQNGTLSIIVGGEAEAIALARASGLDLQ